MSDDDIEWELVPDGERVIIEEEPELPFSTRSLLMHIILAGTCLSIALTPLIMSTFFFLLLIFAPVYIFSFIAAGDLYKMVRGTLDGSRTVVIPDIIILVVMAITLLYPGGVLDATRHVADNTLFFVLEALIIIGIVLRCGLAVTPERRPLVRGFLKRPTTILVMVVGLAVLLTLAQGYHGSIPRPVMSPTTYIYQTQLPTDIDEAGELNLSKEGSPYHVQWTHISSNVTVNIEAGTVIVIDDFERTSRGESGFMRIYGQLLGNGSEEEPIVFSGGRIEIRNDESVCIHCVFNSQVKVHEFGSFFLNTTVLPDGAFEYLHTGIVLTDERYSNDTFQYLFPWVIPPHTHVILVGAFAGAIVVETLVYLKIEDRRVERATR